MSILVKATPAPKARTDSARKMSLFYAAILVLLVVAQLYSFDEFAELVVSFNLPLGSMLVYALAPTLIVLELFAVPFLLRMALSPAFRWVSMAFGLLAAVTWLGITSWVAATYPDVTTIGFLGTVVTLAPGWWAVLVSLAFVILALWSAWGLWPGKRDIVKK